MPIYEFYCDDCHVIYQFFSRSVNTRKRPGCPKCGKPKLSREVSRFAITGKAKEPGEGMDDLPIDEERMMNALASLEQEAGSMDEDDPRAAAQFMRKFADMSGMPVNDAMDEAIRRMEAGENPESIEADLGDALDGDDLFKSPAAALKRLRNRTREPGRDPELYDL